jgi:phage gp29-like protein
MIRSWPRLAKNIGKIRNAMACAPFTVTPWADTDGTVPAEAAARASLVERVIKGMRPVPGTLEMDWEDTLRTLAEDYVRGTGVAEMLWHTHDDGGGIINAIRAIRRTHPAYYAWKLSGDVQLEGNEDRLLFRRGGRRGARTLEPWPENQFLIQLAPAWNDHPAMAGLLGTLAMWWIAAVYGPQWLMQFAQIFGIPFRWANYPSGDEAARDVVHSRKAPSSISRRP